MTKLYPNHVATPSKETGRWPHTLGDCTCSIIQMRCHTAEQSEQTCKHQEPKVETCVGAEGSPMTRKQQEPIGHPIKRCVNQTMCVFMSSMAKQSQCDALHNFPTETLRQLLVVPGANTKSCLAPSQKQMLECEALLYENTTMVSQTMHTRLAFMTTECRPSV